MPQLATVITDARLEQLRTQALIQTCADLGTSAMQATIDVAEALRELIQRRHGEFICPQCQIRQDGPKRVVEF